jgi:hypothetical protein
VILRHRLERLECATDALDLLVRHRLDRALDHLAFDDPPEVVEAGEIVEVNAGRDCGALRQGDDQPLRLEPADSLADRDVADPEAPLQLGDVDALARLDLAGEQRLPQEDGHVVDDAHALDRVVAGCVHGVGQGQPYNI